MKRNGSLIFFCFVQAIIFLVLRKFDSFTESKWMLAGLEALLVFVTVSWYVLSQANESQEKRRPRPTLVRGASEEGRDSLKAGGIQEKKDLEEEIEKKEETESFLRQRLQDAEEEKEKLQEKIQQIEGRIAAEQKTRSTCRQTIQELGFEIRKLTRQISRERREHAIEVRALLRKEGGEDAKLSSSPPVPKVAMHPLAAVVSLLASCQKGLERPGEWPSQNHRVLVRRKLFDVAKKTAVTPLIVASLEHPADLYISPKIEVAHSAEEVHAIVEAYREELSQLDHFEPFYLHDEQSMSHWTAFRLTWENLDDIIIFARSETK